MAETGTAGFESLLGKTHAMAENMVRTEKAAQGLTGIFGQLTKSIVAGELGSKILGSIIERSATYQRINQAITKENLNRYVLSERELVLRGKIRKLEQEERNAAGDVRERWSARLENARGLLANLEKQKLLAKAVEEAGNARIQTAKLFLTLTTDLFVRQQQFNQNLIEANSSFEHRNGLMQRTLMLQAQSGISFASATTAARALVHYGMDTQATFEANLELVSKMEQGLGVAVDESARLASVVERQVKGSFKAVADTISQIVNDTALAGNEAARLALNISTALGRLRPGLGAAGLPEVVGLVGRYESALKEIGGAPGGFQELVNNLTSLKGAVGAGALGVQPEMVATRRGLQEVFSRFERFGKTMVGNLNGLARFQALEQLGEIFGVSADQANQMLMAIQRVNEQQTAAISVQERWKQQLNATNSGLTRLGNSLLGVIQTGLLPVVNLIGFLTNKLADFVEIALKSKTVVYVLGTTLTVAAIAATASLWNVARALWGVAAASGARGLLGLGAGATTGGGILQGGWGVLWGSIRASFMGNLLVATAPFAAAAYWLGKIYQQNKESREDQLAARQIIQSSDEQLEASRKARLYAAARFGTASDVMSIYRGLIGDTTAKFQDIADPLLRMQKSNEYMAKKMQETGLDIATGVTTGGMWTPLEERTLAQKQREEEMRDLTEKLLKVNVEQREQVARDIRAKQEQRQEQALNQTKDRVWFLRGRYNPLGNASDYWSEFGQ